MLVAAAPARALHGLVMLETINIGVRYFLPAYPFLFILAGAMLDWLLGAARPRGGARSPLRRRRGALLDGRWRPRAPSPTT